MNDQAQKLREIFAKKRDIKEAKTIAVLSGKGGVGKSNFALNFSIGLSEKGKRVLLFDLDFGMGNIDVLMGLTPKKTIVQMFKESLRLDEIIEKGHGSLSYVAAGSGLSELFQLDNESFEYFVHQLRSVSMSYDYIIFDMGAGMNEHHLHFALAAHECFVITTTEPTSITDAYAVMKHIYAEQKNLPISVLVNRANHQKDGEETLERLQIAVERFLNQRFQTLGILPDDRTVVQAVKEQTPFMLKSKHTQISQSLLQIIDLYLKQKPYEQSVLPRHSFVTRLKMIFTRKVD
ncbi:MinD/ParA family protein [Salinibacillus xinjiangensis]|uniref:AAA family ATPase n=1 Tax=Salinibacillus xinjiangensis TaxID=1229268 RepID=A0A6G1X332_9BACI|nr:MinD/ParA family protein [Salinibacillus xinjiangensis]MRG85381.1 AAA family ATPase [Salinibacillus xinjiangensis]